MKKSCISLILCFVALFLFPSTVRSQQYEWVKGGGSIYDFSSLPSHEWEQTKFMCTDPDGNVYALSQVGDDPMVADTFSRTGAFGANQNILITSYNCNGQMRWAKLLASAGGDCTPFGIVSDNLGHVYVSGEFIGGGSAFHIGYDTTISAPTSNYLAIGLIQFDTSGNFKWIRYVGDNTFTAQVALASHEDPITMDAANNIHYFCYTLSGVTMAVGVTSSTGVYDIAYNPSGTLLSAVRLDIDSQWFLHGAVIDPVTNKLYTCGEINQSLYLGGRTDSFFAAAFDLSRNKKWQYFTSSYDDNALGGITLDQSKHLHFCGEAVSPSTTTTTFSFNGDSVINTLVPSYYEMSVILTTDTNGHPQWIAKFDGTTDVNGFTAITQLPNGKVAATGIFAGAVVDSTHSIATPSGEGQNPFFVILDSAGDLQTIQQIHGDGFYDGGSAITSDKVGNIYVGGEVVDSIWGGTMPAYHTSGGNTDFFVMKYGVDCSCTTAPTASYTIAGTSTINTTYTGTTTGLDSVVWNFGDGSATATGSTATHTYADTGTFRVCATVYTDCGSDIHCSNFAYEPSLASVVPSMPNVKVYPNPANDELNITGVTENTNYQLLNVTGLILIQGVLVQGNNTLPMQKFTPGIYILEMTQADGQRSIVRVVKE